MGSNDNFEKLLANMNAEERKKKAAAKKEPKKFVKTFYIQNNGEYIFRLFPNLKDPMASPFYKVYVHLGFVLPNSKKNYPFKCLGNRCPLCEDFRKKNKKEKDSGNGNSAWRYEARERFIYYGLDKKGDIIRLNLTEKVHQTIKQAIEDELTNKKDPYNPLDLEDGCFLKFRKDMKSKNGKTYPVYSVQILRGSAKPVKPKLRGVLSELPPLKDTFRQFTAKDYVNVIAGKEVNMESAKNKKIEPKQVFNKEGESKKSKNSEENQELSLEELMEEDDN